ncbi:MAG: discoidin domain-containing protein [bacterium]
MKAQYRVAVMLVLVICGWAGMLRAALLQPGDTIAGGAATTTQGTLFNTGAQVVDGLSAFGFTGEWFPGDNGWVTIDLGRAFRLSDVNVLNSDNGGGGNLRATSNFTFKVSTTGAFAGEESTFASGVLQPKASGWLDISLPAFGDSANSNLVVRYLRFTCVNHVGAGPGLAEVLVNGVPDRGTGALETTNRIPGVVKAKAYTRTAYLSDTAPASWTLRQITTNSASVLQSSGKTVTSTPFYPGYPGANLVDGNVSSYLFLRFSGVNENYLAPDQTDGNATIDLGSEMLVDRIDLVNSAQADRTTSNFAVRVSNDSTFASGKDTEVWRTNFVAVGQSLTNVLAQPALGRYVQFVALRRMNAYPCGLGEMRVYGRTCTSATLASGTSQVGDSSTSGSIALGTPLSVGSYLLALDVTSSGGWSSSTLSTVEILPARGSLLLIK